MRRLFMATAAAVVGVILCAGVALSDRCVSAWLTWDVVLPVCPAGEPKVVASLRSDGLARGEEARIQVAATLHYAGEDDPWHLDDRPTGRRTTVEGFTAELALVIAQEQRPLACEWEGARCRAEVPADLPDGDHYLRATVVVGELAPATVEAPVAFYAPALVHVLTDRPLFEPGDTVQFRALTLGLLDGLPLADRSGRWTVSDPSGRAVFAEPGQGGPFGISDSTLPLAHDAPAGTWTVRWHTGDDQGQATFDVRRYSLPRLRVEASTLSPWSAPGDDVTVQGSLRTASGVPVAGAEVSLALPGDGWPPPRSWTDTPPVRTDREGVFRLVLPEVPTDLPSALTLAATVTAVGPTGERVATTLPVVLSPDPIVVDAVTELGEGLVPDLSNRVYLRVGTPDGRPLPGRDVRIDNPWDPRDTGRSVVSDADGVVAFQVDPGQPVRLLVPAPVVREPPALPAGDALSLEALTALAGEPGTLVSNLGARLQQLDQRCGWQVRQRHRRSYGLVLRGGRAGLLAPIDDALDACVAAGLVGTRGGDGVYELRLSLTPPGTAVRLRPNLEVAGQADLDSVVERLVAAAERAEGCVQGVAQAPEDPLVLHWQTVAGHPRIGSRLLTGAGWTHARCVAAAFDGLSLDDADTEEVEGAAGSAHGVLRLTMQVPEPARAPAPPAPTTTLGYELAVTVDGVGRTTWRARPGVAPPLRLRPSSVLLEPGEAFTARALRGPGHVGELPATITLQAPLQDPVSCPRTPAQLQEGQELDPACPAPDDSELFALRAPRGRGGFVRLEVQGAVAQVYVRPSGGHQLSLTSDAAVYAPGRTATIELSTGQPAVVSLVGVDTALSQLARLPAGDELARAAMPVRSSGKVLGAFDAFALASGQVRGEHAALATIQRLSLMPLPPLDRAPHPVGAVGDQVGPAELLAAFYPLLTDVRRALSATEGTVDHQAYADAWTAAAESHRDPYGRPLRLSLLPDELLEQADPRNVVVDAARLPEDIEPWIPWVKRSSP